MILGRKNSLLLPEELDSELPLILLVHKGRYRIIAVVIYADSVLAYSDPEALIPMPWEQARSSPAVNPHRYRVKCRSLDSI